MRCRCKRTRLSQNGFWLVLHVTIIPLPPPTGSKDYRSFSCWTAAANKLIVQLRAPPSTAACRRRSSASLVAAHSSFSFCRLLLLALAYSADRCVQSLTLADPV
ncbi:hypothetical protein BO85DRAFT_271740 [Aspergillus piperis CBS 112811]|uniref:Uncharacterized protein n=1 Tax=Aspergillus piperis CBS 112811 TaxID=1448313 RepID=A0A8G1VLZ3_9EURO|nr:hypothetical protein BO85DRAFT_271740 [Aspergillus piperis CBS 112811]RAH58309.1 hypothetical protein BO85DRAFT_271740 [Aspergillus piperis CBS 112811]